MTKKSSASAQRRAKHPQEKSQDAATSMEDAIADTVHTNRVET